MKKFLSLGFLLLSCLNSRSQVNMVPNGNFESYTTCPNGLSQTANCTGWSSWTNGTSDYFNSCATTGGITIPGNTFGYQYAASGNGYVGGYQDASSANPYKEYMTRAITPLQVGATYEVSISVSLANTYGQLAVDDIGIYFYKNTPSYITTTNRVVVVPQVDYSGNGAFADTANWKRLVKTFVADSAYDHIAIGSFKDPATVVKQPVGSGTTSYYYFDSVVVKLFDSLYFIYTDTLLCAGDSFNLQYFVAKNGIFASGNIFTVQLSDPSGSFSGTITDIGSLAATGNGIIPCKIPMNIAPGTAYRVRITASKPKYTSKINDKDIVIGIHPQDLEAKVGSPLCVGDPIQLDAGTSTPGASFAWKGPKGFTSALQAPTISNSNPMHNGYYVVTASVAHCTSVDSVQVSLMLYPLVTLFNNSPVCVQDTIQLSATSDIPGVTFSWTGPENYTGDAAEVMIPNSTKSMSGMYNIKVSNSGCDVSMSTEVKVIDIEFNLGSDTMLCNRETKVLNSGISEGAFLWSDGSTDTSYTVREQGRYWLTITHPVCGLRTDTIDVNYENCECSPFVPTAFTPNNDGLNDKVGPIMNCRASAYKFFILNRFGEVVFKSTLPGEKWDGMYKGQPAELSTYFYLLQMTGPRNREFQFKGDIILMR